MTKRQLLDASEALLSLHDTGIPVYDGTIAEHMDNQVSSHIYKVLHTTGFKCLAGS